MASLYDMSIRKLRDQHTAYFVLHAKEQETIGLSTKRNKNLIAAREVDMLAEKAKRTMFALNLSTKQRVVQQHVTPMLGKTSFC